MTTATPVFGDGGGDTHERIRYLSTKRLLGVKVAAPGAQREGEKGMAAHRPVGRVAVVTGGTRGVGAGIARALLAAGADVVVCARRPPDHPLAAAGRKARFRALDVRDAAAAADFFARCVTPTADWTSWSTTPEARRTACSPRPARAAPRGSSS